MEDATGSVAARASALPAPARRQTPQAPPPSSPAGYCLLMSYRSPTSPLRAPRWEGAVGGVAAVSAGDDVTMVPPIRSLLGIRANGDEGRARRGLGGGATRAALRLP